MRQMMRRRPSNVRRDSFVGFVFTDVITSNLLTGYNLMAKVEAAGWNTTSPVMATVTISSGVYVKGTSASESGGGIGFQIGERRINLFTFRRFPVGSILKLINYGYLLGGGGAGGNLNSGGGGYAGGTGLDVTFGLTNTLQVDNQGVIGGGGGGGKGYWLSGYQQNQGGFGAPYAGSLTSPQNGFSGVSGLTVGGNGGAWGQPGCTTGATGAGGGAAGNCVTNNANITWINTGTRYGTIA